MADVFVWVQANQHRDLDWQIERYVQMIFCNFFHTPDRDEHGMQLANLAALNSADLARQVGAAICTSDGSTLSIGWNEVPKWGGGV
jgi:deoxycytidylate deaminase